jgi:hypothetical protein
MGGVGFAVPACPFLLNLLCDVLGHRGGVGLGQEAEGVTDRVAAVGVHGWRPGRGEEGSTPLCPAPRRTAGGDRKGSRQEKGNTVERRPGSRMRPILIPSPARSGPRGSASPLPRRKSVIPSGKRFRTGRHTRAVPRDAEGRRVRYKQSSRSDNRDPKWGNWDWSVPVASSCTVTVSGYLGSLTPPSGRNQLPAMCRT